MTLLRPDSVQALQQAVERYRAGTGQRAAIPRGMGRSYGDAAQLAGGVVLATTRLKGFSLDPVQGTVTAQAGTTLGELLQALQPAGFTLPVLPGTQHVSIGGAIASDVHGKNHGTVGTFGNHVEALGLLTSAAEVLELTPESDHGLFAATLGGMGLTGVMVWARIRLQPITSPLLSVDTERVQDLEEALAALRAPGGSHRVAWLDLLCSRPGRGVVTRAERIEGFSGELNAGGPAVRNQGTRPARATVPERWPGGLLRTSTVRTFNELRYRLAPRHERGRVETIAAHMFPLDSLDHWPRLYGRRGLLQYQFAVPSGQEQALHTVTARLRDARVPCFLAILKDLGPSNEAPLSFPLEGWTLALDLPRAAPGVDALLDGFDELVAEAGGRVYLTKDARLGPEATTAMYPRLEEWRSARDRADPERLWCSDLALRTGLVRATEQDRRGTLRSCRAGMKPERRRAREPVERRVLLIGGSSEIGIAIVRRLAAESLVRPYLLGRGAARLADAAAMLERAGCTRPEVSVLDAEDLGAHREVVGDAFERMGGFDLVVLAVGVLGAQAGLDADLEESVEVMRVNFVGCGSLLLECTRRLRDQGGGTVVVLSSVAAERPRAGNAIYGAAKTGLDALAQGLADASAQSGVRVLVVRPGFVTTRMTAGLRPAPMATTPEAVAEATARALAGRSRTVWVPARLQPVFAVLRHLPRAVYRRLPL